MIPSPDTTQYAFAVAIASAFAFVVAFAFASEIGPDFSPGNTGHRETRGFSPRDTRFYMSGCPVRDSLIVMRGATNLLSPPNRSQTETLALLIAKNAMNGAPRTSPRLIPSPDTTQFAFAVAIASAFAFVVAFAFASEIGPDFSPGNPGHRETRGFSPRDTPSPMRLKPQT